MSDASAAPTTETQTPVNPAPKRDLSLLAAEFFGDEFHGETPEVAPDVAVQTEEAPVADGTDAGETEESAEPDVSELIRQHFESDGELLKKIKLGVKVDGQHGEATLDDLVRSYQIQTAAEKRLEDSKAKSAEILAGATAKLNKSNEQLVETAALVERLEARLTSSIKSVDMDRLRREDPAEWAAKNAEFEKERLEIQQIRSDAVAKYHKATQTQQQEAKTAFEQFLAKEQVSLLEKRPEWRDAETFKNARTKLTEFLSTFNQNTAQQVSHNHELLLLAEEARLYRELKANTNAAAKKLEKVPKVLKPGTPTPPETSQKARLDKLRSVARKTGSVDDAFALLKARRSK